MARKGTGLRSPACCLALSLTLCVALLQFVGAQHSALINHTDSLLNRLSSTTPVSNTTLFHQCTTISAALFSAPICIDLIVDNSCVFTLRVTIADVPFERQFEDRLPPEVCIQTNGLCEVCIRFNDLTAESGCIELVLTCQGLELTQIPFGCFDIPNSGACLACPKDCSGHGDCNNGECICEDGFVGEDCSIGHPGAFWKSCVPFPLSAGDRVCFEVSFTLCDMNVAVTTQADDGSNSQILFQTNVELADVNPDVQYCRSYLGCEACLGFKNFVFNTTSKLASGCPKLTINCFGLNLNPGDLGCFTNSPIVGSCDSCPEDCNAPNGECVNGACKCKGDWQGFACSYKDCVGNCSFHGRCELGRCICDNGYSGETCAMGCDVGTDKMKLSMGLKDNIALDAGKSFVGFVPSELNLAGLTFVIHSRTNTTLNAYARRDCQANEEYHDAKMLGILPDPTVRSYYGPGAVFHVVKDCFLGNSGGRWYLNITCSPCATCERKCIFDLGTYWHSVKELLNGVSVPKVPIMAGQRHHYLIRVPQNPPSYLSIRVTQTPTNMVPDTRLSLVALQESRCPTLPPYDLSATAPTSSEVFDKQYVHEFFLVKQEGLRKGEYFIRIDGCDETNARRCELMNYTITADVSNSYCEKDCKNGGLCVGVNGCRCNTGWSGSTCEIASCASCVNGACTQPNKCICNAGWSGASCSEKKKEETHESTSVWDKAAVVIGAFVALGMIVTAGGVMLAYHYWKKANPSGFRRGYRRTPVEFATDLDGESLLN